MRASHLKAAMLKRPTILVLWLRNRFLRETVRGPGDSIVSLTTYGERLSVVYLAIESIARGKTKPRRCILWLSPPESEAKLPRSLQRLAARGLEIRRCADLGSHKKYFPYLNESTIGPEALVTADDDVLYPRSWLQGLEKVSGLFPEKIVCYRAKSVSTSDSGTSLSRYAGWPPCESTIPSILNIAIGVSGIRYPVSFQERVLAAGDRFLACAPRADDLWLHFLAVSFDYQIVQVDHLPKHFPAIPRTGRTGLAISNVIDGGNDRQVEQTYTASAIAKIWAVEIGGNNPKHNSEHPSDNS